jgi:GT2 family glycosyltransferase
MSDVCVVVVSWNTRDLLGRCLDSLKPDADAGLAQVVVVDNASSDGSPEMVRDRHPWAELVEPGMNLGFGPAVNLGAAGRGGDWVVAANADTAPEPGALALLLGAAARRPDAGIAAPRLIQPDGSTQHSVHPFPTVGLALSGALGVWSLPGVGGRLAIERRWDPEQARLVDWAHGAFLLMRRPAFDEIGGFDESQWMYAEDLDLAWRMAATGWRCAYEPSARVLHETSAAAKQAFGDERAERHMAASYSWMARRQGLLRTRLSAMLSLAGAIWRTGVYSMLARPWPTRYGGRAATYRAWTRLHRLGLRPRRELLAPQRRD